MCRGDSIGVAQRANTIHGIEKNVLCDICGTVQRSQCKFDELLNKYLHRNATLLGFKLHGGRDLNGNLHETASAEYIGRVREKLSIPLLPQLPDFFWRKRLPHLPANR